MKRFTLFLALCLTMIGTALAGNITDISQLNETKKYTISCARGYLLTHGDEPKLKGNQEGGVNVSFDISKEIFHFQFKRVGDSYYLFNVGANKYVNNDGSTSKDATNAIQFSAQTDGTFLLYFDATHYINLGGSKQVIINDYKTPDQGNKMTISEIPDQLVNVTWNYYIGDQLYTTKNETLAGNTDCTAPAVDFFVAENQSASNTGSAPTLTINVYGHENLPFEVTTDLQNNPKWYAVSLHTNNDFFLWHYEANDALVKTPVPAKKSADYNVLSDDAYWWCFTGNLIDGFKIYNKAAGTNYTLNSTATQAQVGTATNNNDLWTLVKSTSSIANSACFQIKGGSDYINHQGGLKYWGSTDEGSSALFYTPASFPVNYVNSYINAPEGAIGGSKYLVGANKASAQEQIAAAEADAMNFAPANTLAATCRAIDEAGFVEMTPGYYRVYSALPGLYKTSKGLYLNGTSVRWGDVTASNAGNIFKFETSASEGKYEVFVCNAQKYLATITGTLSESTGTYTPVNVVSLGSAQFNLQMQELVTKADETTEVQTKTMHANGHYGGSGNEGNIIHWNGSANSASAWYLVPAKRFEVTLRTVDNASYATTYLPFAVEGDGVTKLYTGSLGDRVLNMNEVSGVVPAETALVLKSATGAASTTLTISNDARSAVSDNALKGTLSNITLNDDNRSNYLVLGRVLVENEGVIGFYLPSNDATSIAANKAYLSNTSAAAIALNFDDVTTGIGQVATESENAPIFDLSGRRVNSTVKGGLYIQNGKKFIVK